MKGAVEKPKPNVIKISFSPKDTEAAGSIAGPWMAHCHPLPKWCGGGGEECARRVNEYKTGKLTGVGSDEWMGEAEQLNV